MSVLAKWLAIRKTQGSDDTVMRWGDYLHKAQVEEHVFVYFSFFGLFMLLCVPPTATQYIFHTPMERYSLYMLKVPLNTKQASKQNKQTCHFAAVELEGKYTLWRCKFTPTQKAKLLLMTSPFYEVSRKYHYAFSIDSVLCKWGRIFTGNYVTPAVFWNNSWSTGNNPNLNPDPGPFQPQISRLKKTGEDYCCAKLQVILIRDFHFCSRIAEHSVAIAVATCLDVCPSHAGIVSKWLNLS